MSKRKIIDVKLYIGRGDFEENEIQVYIYLALTIPQSRCRIRKGGPEGKYVTSPVNYSVNAKDLLEYMPRHEDLAYLLMKLMEADVLRDIRRQIKSKSDEEIKNILLKKKTEFEVQEKKNEKKIRQFTKLSITEMVKEIKRTIIGGS